MNTILEQKLPEQKPRPNSIWVKRKTRVLTSLLGPIPLSLGNRLRCLFYRSILGDLGEGVYLGTELELGGARGIFLGAGSAIDNRVRLDSGEPNGRIILRLQVLLDRGVSLEALGGSLEIGEQTCIGPYVCMAGPGNIQIGKNCMIASHVSIYANNHIFTDLHTPIGDQGVSWTGIVIEDDCWLGTGVRVLDGVTIGHGSVVGAGAVVTKSLPPFSVAVGVPAKVMYKRSDATSKSVAA
ncbi:acyltransferase [Nodosilinea sp. LEGE 06152]|uniref:acyltransferase n=1 Tax=Nodosilinea sp. LEGE 06152 TaxID=2777966 RepID=UPI001880AB59|nr:acyltransferase [Nodosilinea sp. LEGE 06152]MBE9157106.1 acyltransferase [Nodosilinea sp. LEGE 06152]